MYKTLIIILIFMSVVTWDMLAKNQTDPETVEECVARLIAEHEADETAHLGVGESLSEHKGDAVIDHPADSILDDKIPNGEISLQKLTADHRILMSAFESLDGWLTGGTVTQEFGLVTIRAGNTINTYAYMYVVSGGIVGIDWSKDFFWQSTVMFGSNTLQNVYFGLGGSDYLSGYSGAGFYVNNGTLYAYHCNDAGAGLVYTTYEITGITLTVPHVYRIIYDQSAGTLSFFIDGVEKKVFTSGLPTENTDELAMFQVKTTSAAYRYLYVYDLLISIPK
jgi:hypothetical protein